jgi:hypothetical protein
VKPAIIFLGLVACLLVLTSFLISPAHYFIVHAGWSAQNAALSVNDGAAAPMYRISGIFFGRTATAEGSAIVQIVDDTGKKTSCGWGYFTAMEFEPHFVSISDCDGKWM